MRCLLRIAPSSAKSRSSQSPRMLLSGAAALRGVSSCSPAMMRHTSSFASMRRFARGPPSPTSSPWQVKGELTVYAMPMLSHQGLPLQQDAYSFFSTPSPLAIIKQISSPPPPRLLLNEESAAAQERESVEVFVNLFLDSVLRKRRKKMNKHKVSAPSFVFLYPTTQLTRPPAPKAPSRSA
jgi:hypothetical protein